MTILPNFLSDTSVNYNSVPLSLENAAARGVLWQAAPERFLLAMPGIARYLVEAGLSITIEQEPNINRTLVEYYLRMAPLAALLYQRGLVAFHAAAVADNKGVILLAGDSWTGKSTLLTALLQRGWTMLTDDLAAVTIDELGRVVVLPTYPEIALWPDTLKKLGINADTLPLCDANRHKLAMPQQIAAHPLPLRAIYWLNVQSKSSVEVEKLAQNLCYRAVGMFLYNSQIADTLMDRLSYLRCASVIAQSIPIYELFRPRCSWSVNVLADHVAQNVQEIIS